MVNKITMTKSRIDDELSKFTRSEVIYKPQVNAFCNRILSNIKSGELKEYFNSKIKQLKFNADGTLNVGNKQGGKTKKKQVRQKEQTDIIKKQKLKAENRVKHRVKNNEKIGNKESYFSEIDFLKNKSLFTICKELSVSKSYIDQIIKTKASNYTDLNPDKPLKESHWELIKEYLEVKYSALKAQRKNKSKETDYPVKRYYSSKRKKGPVKSSGVYGEIAKHGLGKLIYTKMK